MTLKLYTFPGNFRAFKALIPAQYNDVAVEVPDFKMLEDNKKPEFLAKNPLGKVPVLETDQGCLFESNAIARYIARTRRDTKLFGNTFYQSVSVDLL
jgi:elongation factor 1-gamma